MKFYVFFFDEMRCELRKVRNKELKSLIKCGNIMSIINFKKIISYNYVYLCMICFFFDCVICFIVYDRLGYYVL